MPSGLGSKFTLFIIHPLLLECHHTNTIRKHDFWYSDINYKLRRWATRKSIRKRIRNVIIRVIIFEQKDIAQRWWYGLAKKVCVCVFFLPTHCTITCFGFRAVWIDGVSVVDFRFTHLLGRPRYLRDMYLYLCTETGDVKVTVCVDVFVLEIVLYSMWDDDNRKEEDEIRCWHMVYSCQ